MSDVIIKGNVVSDLGAYLPTPYIQEVLVYPDKLEIKCSLYLNFLDKSEEEISDIIADLQNLQVYAFYALGPEYSQKIIDKKAPNIFKEFAIGRQAFQDTQPGTGITSTSGMDFLQSDIPESVREKFEEWGPTMADWLDSAAGTYPKYFRKFEAPNHHQLPFSDFTRGDTALRDEEDNQIIEFSATFTISVYADFYWTASRTSYDQASKVFSLNESAVGVGGQYYLFAGRFGGNQEAAALGSGGTSTLYTGYAPGTGNVSATGITVFAFSSFLDYNGAFAEPWVAEDEQYSVGGASSADQPTSWAYARISDEARVYNAIYPVLPNRLATKQISNIAYESVFKDNTLNRDPQILYVTPDGANYNDTPIQVGSGTYYTQDGITLEEITAKFQELVDENENTKNENLKNIVDNMSLILETYGESHNLLVKLGNLGRAFTSKTTATLVGKLYQRYKKRYAAVSTATARGKPLTKKLQRNLKIRDLREANLTDQGALYIQPVYGVDWFDTQSEFFDVNNIKDSSIDLHGHKIIYTPENLSPATHTSVDMYKTELDPDTSATFRGNIYYGYFFVDQEKAIKLYSNLAQILNVDKIELWFGKEIINQNFRFEIVNMVSSYGTTGDVPWSTGHGTGNRGGVYGAIVNTTEVYFDYSSGWPEPSMRDLLNKNTQGTVVAEAQTFVNERAGRTGQTALDYFVSAFPTQKGGDTHPAGITVIRDTPTKARWGTPNADGDYDYFYTYVMPRNITSLAAAPYYATGDGYMASTEDYRLMAFEYQFATDRPYANNSLLGPWADLYYYVGVQFKDTTLDIYRQLLLNYYYHIRDNGSDWSRYIDLTTETCNYNSATGQFNTFFADAMKTHYGAENPETLPWVRAPVVYCMHRDIIYNKFNGDISAAMEAAKKISDNINPETGNLIAAQDFAEEAKAFYDEFYGNAGGATRAVFEGINGSKSVAPSIAGEDRYKSFGGLAGGQPTDPHNWSYTFNGSPQGCNTTRAFIWDMNEYQTDIENNTSADRMSPNDPGIGIELGRSAQET